MEQMLKLKIEQQPGIEKFDLDAKPADKRQISDSFSIFCHTLGNLV